jgi:hypothetical protein
MVARASGCGVYDALTNNLWSHIRNNILVSASADRPSASKSVKAVSLYSEPSRWDRNGAAEDQRNTNEKMGTTRGRTDWVYLCMYEGCAHPSTS